MFLNLFILSLQLCTLYNEQEIQSIKCAFHLQMQPITAQGGSRSSHREGCDKYQNVGDRMGIKLKEVVYSPLLNPPRYVLHLNKLQYRLPHQPCLRARMMQYFCMTRFIILKGENFEHGCREVVVKTLCSLAMSKGKNDAIFLHDEIYYSQRRKFRTWLLRGRSENPL